MVVGHGYGNGFRGCEGACPRPEIAQAIGPPRGHCLFNNSVFVDGEADERRVEQYGRAVDGEFHRLSYQRLLICGDGGGRCRLRKPCEFNAFSGDAATHPVVVDDLVMKVAGTDEKYCDNGDGNRCNDDVEAHVLRNLAVAAGLYGRKSQTAGIPAPF